MLVSYNERTIEANLCTYDTVPNQSEHGFTAPIPLLATIHRKMLKHTDLIHATSYSLVPLHAMSSSCGPCKLPKGGVLGIIRKEPTKFLSDWEYAISGG